MSTAPSPPVKFLLHLGVLGFSPCPPSLRAPPQIIMGFPASWYELSGPYVGSAELNSAQFASSTSVNNNATSGGQSPVTRRYGYRIPPKGQLQLVLKNELGTIRKVLLIPYDLLDMPMGSKTFIRVRYVCDAKEGKEGKEKGREVTVYAVHLNFVSPPARSGRKRGVSVEAGTTFDMEMEMDDPLGGMNRQEKQEKMEEKKEKPKIFLSKSIRLIFPSRTPDEEERLRPVREEPGEGSSRFSSWPTSVDQEYRSRGQLQVSPSPQTSHSSKGHIRRKSLLGGPGLSLEK